MSDPEEHGMELAVPFIVCQSKGGPYEDAAFVAGFQCGEIDRALLAGAAVGAQTVRFPIVHSGIVKQLELHAMNRGYPYVTATRSDEWPEWSDVTFSTVDPAAGGGIDLRMCPLHRDTAMPITGLTFRCPKCGLEEQEEVNSFE